MSNSDLPRINEHKAPSHKWYQRQVEKAPLKVRSQQASHQLGSPGRGGGAQKRPELTESEHQRFIESFIADARETSEQRAQDYYNGKHSIEYPGQKSSPRKKVNSRSPRPNPSKKKS